MAFSHRVITLLIPFVLAALVACTPTTYKRAAPGLSEASAPSRFDYVYTNSERPLGSFSRVFIAPTQVEFSDYWLREYRADYTQRDLTRLTEQYAGLLDKSLRQSIEKSGQYQLVESAQAAEVVFQPKLLSLNIYAPDLALQGSNRQYIHEAGNATFDITLIAADNTPLLQLVDNRETTSSIGRRVERTNRAINARYFSRMMDRWSNNLVDYLQGEK